jgi:BA14K-like protein
MNRFAKASVLALAAAATVIAPMTQASAEDWRNRRHNHNSDALVAGVIGLAAGAIIVGALADQNNQPRVYYRQRVYDEPVYDGPAFDEPVYAQPDEDYYPPQPRPHIIRRHPQVIYSDNYAGSFEPWTRGWYQYCASRYRSFNPDRGTYRGNDGLNHFCKAG